MYSDGPLYSLCSFNVARRPAENAKSVIHTQSESNFLAEESQKGSSASSPFNRATAFLRLRPRVFPFKVKEFRGLSIFFYTKGPGMVHLSLGVLTIE